MQPHAFGADYDASEPSWQSPVSKLVDLYKENLEEWSKEAVELEGVIKAFELPMKVYEVAKRSNTIAVLEVWALKTTTQMMIKEIRKSLQSDNGVTYATLGEKTTVMSPEVLLCWCSMLQVTMICYHIMFFI
ncbi:hypothetical protein Salat_1190200 [Sesamum alatum]|uniref:Uncharacterized protein n=1 Tax=Sesamum alatum TaxID=300844 RepID=A0AAE1YF39_9LAMI|nr:hypothetical protein Salat_1190200 [Sesamum alatum]